MFRKFPSIISVLLILGLSLSIFSLSEADTYAASSKPKYIAHRGWSTRAPENTLSAFKLAAKYSGFYGVEFDVWEAKAEKSGDPLLLVMHDEDISRMCGVDVNIHDITRDDLNNYTIINGRNVNTYSNEKIPTLEQAVDTIYTYSKGAIPVIELKERLSKRALKYLLRSLGGRKAVIISFEFGAVADAEKMARNMGLSKKITTMYLRSKLSAKKYSSVIRKMKSYGIDCISLKYTCVSKKTIQRFHKSRIKVCIWSLPSKKTARKYARMGVDYITADGKVF